jgi:hypothetical protein
MPAPKTALTEIGTALGTLAPTLDAALENRPRALQNVADGVWQSIVERRELGDADDLLDAAFSNGVALLEASDGLRGRTPRLVEWRGPHRIPGDDVVPADVRIDHVFLVSCKYFSRILLNCGPVRVFDRLLVGEERSAENWFVTVAREEYAAFYDTVSSALGLDVPRFADPIGARARAILKDALGARRLPDSVEQAWQTLSTAVSERTATRWASRLPDRRRQLRLLWRLLRIGDTSYYVLGAGRNANLRLRVASAWDWMQRYELLGFEVSIRRAGQPEVGWMARCLDRATAIESEVRGHVEIRWSRGRFQGAPEAKVYLDSSPTEVPGYFDLV